MSTSTNRPTLANFIETYFLNYPSFYIFDVFLAKANEPIREICHKLKLEGHVGHLPKMRSCESSH